MVERIFTAEKVWSSKTLLNQEKFPELYSKIPIPSVTYYM